MVGLLDLPLELREPILLDVILDTTQQPPNDPASAERSEGYEVMKTNGYCTEPWGHIHCKPLQRHAMPLLHVNQQIRDEIIDLMPRKLAQRVDDAKLDVLCVEEVGRDLWATWLSAPFPTNNLNTLHAQIRDFQIPSSSARLIMHQKGSIGKDCKYWVNLENAEMLLRFLADFLRPRTGTTSIHKSQRIASADGNQLTNRTIQNLTIDIPFDPDQQDSLKARIRCSWCTDPGGDISTNHARCRIPSGKRAALIFAQFLLKQLLHMFETVSIGWRRRSFLRIIFEAIGTIHLKVGGRSFGSLNLSQILAELPRSEQWNGCSITRSEFFQWKRAAEEERKTAGFTMVNPSVQEHELVGSAGIIASMLSARGESIVRDVTIPQEDVEPSARQTAVNGRVAFTGKSMFIQEDGSSLPGHTTFYYSADMPLWVPVQRPFAGQPADYPHVRDCEEEYIEEQPKDGELVLFKRDAILFRPDNLATSVDSGEATFYGTAEERNTEQPFAIEEDSPQAGDHRGTCGT